MSKKDISWSKSQGIRSKISKDTTELVDWIDLKIVAGQLEHICSTAGMEVWVK